MRLLKDYTKCLIFSLAVNDYSLKKKLNLALVNHHLIILNLHKIAQPDGSSWKPLNPIIFRELLGFISKNFEVTTFQNLNNSNIDKANRPKIILSFDDGYKDFIEYAVPILFEFGIKVNQNVIPNCSIKGIPPLNVIAQDWIGQAPIHLIQKLDIPDFIPPSGMKDRVLLGTLISKFLKSKPFVKQQEYFDYLLPQFLNLDTFEWTKVMNLQDIQDILPYHEIGLHSMNHENMDQESDEYFKGDLLNCLKFADEQLKITEPIYAFPNGAYRNNQIEILKSAGFSQILLVGDQVSRIDRDIHNRFGFYADSLKEAKLKATGNSLSFKKSCKL